MFAVVEKDVGDMSMVEAIKYVINDHGDRLYLAYGYIRESKITREIFQEVVKFLKKDKANRVCIIIGIFPDGSAGDGFARSIREINEQLNKLIPDTLYADNVSARFRVLSVKNFHSKLSVMFKSHKSGFKLCSAVTGSSNLSYSALANQDRMELDLLIKGEEVGGPLKRFQDVAKHHIRRCFYSEECELGKLIDDKFHWEPYFLEHEMLLHQIDEEIFEKARRQEHIDRQYYRYSTRNPEDGIALSESDKAQEIAYDL